jgi:hypothetical protein
MSKRASLTEALRQATGRIEPSAPSVQPTLPTKSPTSPGRRGKKTIAGFFDPAVSRQLKQIATDEDSNIQELLREAINDLFEKRGKGRIA